MIDFTESLINAIKETQKPTNEAKFFFADAISETEIKIGGNTIIDKGFLKAGAAFAAGDKLFAIQTMNNIIVFKII